MVKKTGQIWALSHTVSCVFWPNRVTCCLFATPGSSWWLVNTWYRGGRRLSGSQPESSTEVSCRRETVLSSRGCCRDEQHWVVLVHPRSLPEGSAQSTEYSLHASLVTPGCPVFQCHQSLWSDRTGTQTQNTVVPAWPSTLVVIQDSLFYFVPAHCQKCGSKNSKLQDNLAKFDLHESLFIV